MPDDPDTTDSRKYANAVAGVSDFQLPGVVAATTSVTALDSALQGLTQTLNKYNQSASMTSGVNRMFDTMTSKAREAAIAVSGVQRAVGGVGSGAGASTSGAIGNGGNTGGSWVANTAARMGGYSSASSWLGDGGAAGMLMAPLKFLQDRISTNRETALAGSGALSMAARQQGTDVGTMMSKMSQFPGQVFGNPSELINLFSVLPRLGGSYNFGEDGKPGFGQGGRAAGLLKGINQAQALAPGQSINEIVGNIGGFASNSAAQRQSAYMTGGAFSMIANGGRQKSLGEWAESITKWLIGLRGGGKKGKPFSYGELMAQYFPGSNIDAWFDVNGVPQGMRDYWWTYALQRANGVSAEEALSPQQENLSYRRLRSQGELTRTEFGLAGAMSGQYANREVSNQWFNQQIGGLQRSLIPALGNSGIGRMISMLPDTLEQMLMSLLGSGVSGGLSAIFGGGDADLSSGIGDTFGEFGSNGTSGMHPDMKKKVGNMMRANPRLSVTSGFRDTGVQQRLKAKGHSRVSGKPSAHTRGLAADLGPPSEYNWIVKNAGKFGLKSGNSQGEPWHVGIGDWTDDPLGMISGGLENFNLIEMIQKLMGFLTDKAGSLFGGVDLSKPGTGPKAFDPEFLKMFPSGTLTGLPVELAALASGSASATGSGNKLARSMPSGASTSDQLGRATTAARAAYAAGFRGDALFKIVSIAGRESQWNPTAANPNTSDRGMWQINMSAHKKSMQQHGFSEQDLFNPANNAMMAYEMSGGGTNFGPWKGSDHSTYAGDGGKFLGKPGFDPAGDPLWHTQQYQTTARNAIAAAGVGDMDAMMMTSMMPSSSSSGGGINFHNSFVISGGGSPGGGIDIRRTVSMIADNLEDEMKRRLARTN